MKRFIEGIFFIWLFSTLVFATGVVESTIVTDDKTNNELVNIADATDIVDLSASSSSGLLVCNFRIKSLPDADAGILYMEDGITAVEVNQNLTQNEADGLMFDPKDGYVGDASFTYSGIDINGDEGSVATVTLPIISGDSADGTTNPGTETIVVVTDDKINPEMLNSLPAVDILNLSGKDGNGVAVDNFIIRTIVSEEAGVLYMADGTTAVEVDQNLTIDEADGLKFDPNDTFVGDANFTYQAVDVNGNLGNIATVTIPVVATLTPDQNRTSEDCECKDYNESIPTLSNLGVLLIVFLTSLAGLLFRRENI
jgi:hypothetical protein